MKSKLWLAIVEHRACPGKKLKLLCQETEPTDEEILVYFADDTGGEDPMEVLQVTSLFDLTCELQARGNLQEFINAAAMADAKAFAEKVEPMIATAKRKP